jgi:hypothetical protein
MLTFDDGKLKELTEKFEKGMKAANNMPSYTREKETIVDGYYAAMSMTMTQSAIIDQLNSELRALRRY